MSTAVSGAAGHALGVGAEHVAGSEAAREGGLGGGRAEAPEGLPALRGEGRGYRHVR